jgi:hypothetical protein
LLSVHRTVILAYNTNAQGMSGQPFQIHGFQTSIDVARQQTYEVASLAGQKRLPEQSPNDSSKVANLKKGIDHSNAGLLDSRAVDFSRPSITPQKNRLVASEIRPVAAAIPPGGSQPGRADNAVPGSSQNPLLFLKNSRYRLPPALVANFAALGVTSIYPWQASCLLARGLLEGERHLVYTAPTGGGKSLVADVLMLKRIIEHPSRKAILVLPYVALVQEKLKWLRRIVENVEKNVPDDDDEAARSKPYYQRWKKLQKSIRVTGYFGGSRTAASWADTDIAVCTIEKVCLAQRSSTG